MQNNQRIRQALVQCLGGALALLIPVCQASMTTLKIEADYIEADTRNGVTNYSGNVLAIEGELTIKASGMVVHQENEEHIKLIVTTGNPSNFHYQSNKQQTPIEGRAQIIKYMPEEGKIVLLGNAHLHGTQKLAIISGECLTYLIHSGILTGQPQGQSRTATIIRSKTPALADAIASTRPVAASLEQGNELAISQ
jgi:lipopolysaccharide transport protein LptA